MTQQNFGSRFFLIIIVCSLALLLSLFWAFAASIVLALLISSVSYPVYARVKRFCKGNETAAALATTLLILVIIMVILTWFFTTLSNEAFDFYNTSRNAVSMTKIRETITSDNIWAQRLRKAAELAGIEFTPEAVQQLIAAVGKRVGLFLYDQVRAMASNLFSFLLNLFLMMMAIYYLLKDGSRLKEYIAQMLPVPSKQMEKVVTTFQKMGRAIIIGNGLSGVVQGILGGFGFYFFGLNAPFLWGTVIAFMAFLPIIGASVVFIPATLFILVQGKVGTGVGFLIYNALYSSIIEYLIKPRVIGNEMQMNSLLVFIGIVGGLKLFGILGIVYGPLIITIFLTLAEIYRLEYKDIG